MTRFAVSSCLIVSCFLALDDFTLLLQPTAKAPKKKMDDWKTIYIYIPFQVEIPWKLKPPPLSGYG